MNYKPLAALLLATALTGCAAIENLDPATKVDKAVEPIPDLEQKMAEKDGRTDAKPYFQVLDAIQGKCYERNRTALVKIAQVMAKTDQETMGDKTRMNYLESLKLLYSEASLHADNSESKQVSCVEVLSYWNQQHKEIAKEAAESEEYDHVMNAGKE
jgi:hypothetical protein